MDGWHRFLKVRIDFLTPTPKITPMNTKTPPEFKPRTAITEYEYDKKVAQYGAPPKGYRFLKVGEKFNQKTDFLAFWIREWATDKTVSVVSGSNHPCITPAPKTKTLPDIGDKFKAYIKGVTEILFLKGEIRDLKSAIEDPKHNFAGVFGLHWSSTTQGADHWCERHSGRVALTPKDILYLKASVAAYEARIAELVPKTPKEPTAEEFRAQIAALNAKVAELERKIASARVTFS